MLAESGKLDRRELTRALLEDRGEMVVIAGLGVIAASSFDLRVEGWGAQIAAGAAALAGALLLTWTERKRPEVQEALIGILFVLASTAQILLLANDLAPQVPEVALATVGVLAARQHYAQAANILKPLANDPHGGGGSESAVRYLKELEAKASAANAPKSGKAAS